MHNMISNILFQKDEVTESDKQKTKKPSEEEVISQSKIHRLASPMELALTNALMWEFYS